MSVNFPNTSFMNLFKNIVYDKETNPNTSLDIWDAYVISPFYKDKLAYFKMHTISANDTWVSIANYYYSDSRLWWLTPLFNDIENPFLVMAPDLFIEDVQQVKILQPVYVNQLLLQVRQQKILDDASMNTVTGMNTYSSNNPLGGNKKINGVNS